MSLGRGPPATCQICFRRQKTSRYSRLVLHGYRRPGHGYIIGDCFGHGYDPWEISCERTKEYVTTVLKETLASWEQNLARLQAKPESLDFKAEVYVGYFDPDGRERKDPRSYFTVRIPRGAPSGWAKSEIVARQRTKWATGPTIEVGDFEQAMTPAYETLLEKQIHEQQGRIGMVKRDIADYEKKIAEWKPQPWPPREVKV